MQQQWDSWGIAPPYQTAIQSGTSHNGREQCAGEEASLPWFDDASASPDDAPEPATALSHRITLHPVVQLLAQSALAGAAATVRNFCTIVGTLRQESGNGRGEKPPRVNPMEQFATSYVLDVAETIADATGAATSPYCLRLTISGRLLDPALVRNGARVALSGALRVVRTYDSSLACGPDDPGIPVWNTNLDIVAIQEVTDEVPDGSWVRLEGEVDGAPVVRDRAIGPKTMIPVLQTQIRCRQALPSSFRRSRARYVQTTVVPVEVMLDHQVDGATALMLPGNYVRLEGRLHPVVFQRRRRDPRVSDAIAYARKTISAQYKRPEAEHRIQEAVERILTGVRMVVDIGYVELVRGRLPSESEANRIEKAARVGRADQVIPKELRREDLERMLDAAQVAWLTQRMTAASEASNDQ